MSARLLNIGLVIVSLEFAIASIIFVLLFIFNRIAGNWMLAAGFYCALLSNLFNVIRIYGGKKDRK